MGADLRRVVAILVAWAFCTAIASATPGQTTAQMVEWGKHNAAFYEFSLKTSLGGYSTYRATLAVDGHAAEYSALIDRGNVYGEYVTFTREPDVWILAGHKPLMTDTVRAIYGADYADDLASAKRAPGVDEGKEIWLGAKLAYIATINSLLAVLPSEVPAILKNLDSCYDIFCS